MRRINLVTMELEGFRSFRERTLIEFSPTNGLKFLSGDNKAEPRLGPNGAGKSTIWDAFIYCMTGASVKGLRASNLLSWGCKTIWVDCGLLVDDQAHLVSRSGMPDVLTLNDEPISQDDLYQFIGMSRARLLHSVIFGQAVPLFIDLPGPERAALLDEVLDLEIWSKAADHAGKSHTVAADGLAVLAKDVAYHRGQLEGMENPDDLEDMSLAWEAELNQHIDQSIKRVEQAEDELAALEMELVKVKEQPLPSLRDLHDQTEKQQQARTYLEGEYRVMFADLQRCQKSMTFYASTTNCPECKQPISAHYSADMIVQLATMKDAMERDIKANTGQVRAATTTLDDLSAELKVAQRKREFVLQKRTAKQAEYDAQERIVESLVSVAEKLADAVNPYNKRLRLLLDNRATVQAKLRQLTSKQRRGRAMLARIDFWRAGFKRVRLFMVKRVLDQLTVEASSAAAGLGLVGWQINFSTELETKSGGMRAGIHVLINAPDNDRAVPWEAWSGGEGQRIRLAVALGLASMIQRMSGVAYEFEIWDEPTAFLGNEGIDDLMECLGHRALTHKKSIWLCDHRALSQVSFDEIWLVSKTADSGSRVYQLAYAEGSQ